jgi:hypothetical protein
MAKEDLLDVSRQVLDATEGVIRNLQDMNGLVGVNQLLHTNALQAGEGALTGAKELNQHFESLDDNMLPHLLDGVDLTGDFSSLEQGVAQELAAITGLVGRIRSPQIDKQQVQKTLEDLEVEIRQMQSAAVRKGIAVLATIARVAIPLL